MGVGWSCCTSSFIISTKHNIFPEAVFFFSASKSVFTLKTKVQMKYYHNHKFSSISVYPSHLEIHQFRQTPPISQRGFYEEVVSECLKKGYNCFFRYRSYDIVKKSYICFLQEAATFGMMLQPCHTAAISSTKPPQAKLMMDHFQIASIFAYTKMSDAE